MNILCPITDLPDRKPRNKWDLGTAAHYCKTTFSRVKQDPEGSWSSCKDLLCNNNWLAIGYPIYTGFTQLLNYFNVKPTDDILEFIIHKRWLQPNQNCHVINEITVVKVQI